MESHDLGFRGGILCPSARSLARNSSSASRRSCDSYQMKELLNHYLKGTKTTRALLVHFGTRSHSIHCHVDQLSRANNFKQTIEVPRGDTETLTLQEDVFKHLVLVGRELVQSLGMTAVMNNTVHIEVEIVELNSIRVWSRQIRRNVLVVNVGSILLHTVGDGLGVFAN